MCKLTHDTQSNYYGERFPQGESYPDTDVIGSDICPIKNGADIIHKQVHVTRGENLPDDS